MEIMVEVTCPMLSCTFDFRVTQNITVEKFVQTIGTDIAAINTDTTILSYVKGMMLFSNYGVLPKEKTLAELRIRSGAKLLLL